MNKTLENTVYDVSSETTEGLLLMAVLAQEPLRTAALRELRIRKTLRQNADFQDMYMTNFSVAAC